MRSFFWCGALGWTVLLMGCIGNDIIDDRVAARINFTQQVDSLAVGDTFTFMASYLNQVGVAEDRMIAWSSRPDTVLSIDASGIAIGIGPGDAWVRAHVETEGAIIRDSLLVHVGSTTSDPASTQRKGDIQTTSTYLLEGSFTLEATGQGHLRLSFGEDYQASERLPGLYVYLTNNPNTANGAFEIGAVEVFKGVHHYDLPADITLNQYDYVLYFCKPFNVKVGDGEIGDP